MCILYNKRRDAILKLEATNSMESEPEPLGTQQDTRTVTQSYHDRGVDWWRERSCVDASTQKPEELEEELETLWPQIFDAMDANSDGKIASDEIVRATENIYKPIGLWLQSKGECGVDADSDGVISLAEWMDARLKMGQEFGAPSSMAIDQLRAFTQSKGKTHRRGPFRPRSRTIRVKSARAEGQMDLEAAEAMCTIARSE